MRHHRLFLAFIFITTRMMYRPRHAAADNPTVLVNNAFFEGVPIDPTAKILRVAADSKVLPHGDADAELIPYAVPGSERKPDSCGLDVSPPVPFTLDCGLKMLGLETIGDAAVYYFLLKDRRDDWYHLILSPQSGATMWIKDMQMSGLSMTVHPFTDWLESQNSFTVSPEGVVSMGPISVRKKPAEESEEVARCAGYEGGEGLIPAEDKARKGDWVHVLCLANGCYAANDPARACLPKLNSKATPCQEGWARWRAKAGGLLLYPHDATPEACSYGDVR